MTNKSSSNHTRNNIVNNSSCICPIPNDKKLEHELIGYLGGIGVSLMLIPQVVKTYQQKSVEGISIMFLFLNLLTGTSFITYGLLEDIHPMIFSNIISIFCSLILIVMYCKWNHKTNHTKNSSNVQPEYHPPLGG